MRVIAGSAKGHKLQTIEGLSTRPTTDRIKETLFNIIAFDLPRCNFLDLFAGSGAIGIEALSRGAAEAVFVDSDATCQKVIGLNLCHTKLDKQGRLLFLEANRALEQLAKEGASFDIIFMDPPYFENLVEPVLKKIAAEGLLKEMGYIIVERAADIPFIPLSGWKILREKAYRTTVLTFLCPEEEKI